eukprot:GHVQ01013145.1.p1 GENE.GHVQ01013145.1~~GHVQ01013145.1.p1  ORF type:complete len:1817 (+),score=214.36 GHVQ01013145.1:910-6360(+)
MPTTIKSAVISSESFCTVCIAGLPDYCGSDVVSENKNLLQQKIFIMPYCIHRNVSPGDFAYCRSCAEFLWQPSHGGDGYSLKPSSSATSLFEAKAQSLSDARNDRGEDCNCHHGNFSVTGMHEEESIGRWLPDGGLTVKTKTMRNTSRMAEHAAGEHTVLEEGVCIGRCFYISLTNDLMQNYPSQMIDIASINGFLEPTLAVLLQNKPSYVGMDFAMDGSPLSLVLVSLNISLGDFNTLKRITSLPADCFALLSTPATTRHLLAAVDQVSKISTSTKTEMAVDKETEVTTRAENDGRHKVSSEYSTALTGAGGVLVFGGDAVYSVDLSLGGKPRKHSVIRELGCSQVSSVATDNNERQSPLGEAEHAVLSYRVCFDGCSARFISADCFVVASAGHIFRGQLVRSVKEPLRIVWTLITPSLSELPASPFKAEVSSANFRLHSHTLCAVHKDGIATHLVGGGATESATGIFLLKLKQSGTIQQPLDAHQLHQAITEESADTQSEDAMLSFLDDLILKEHRVEPLAVCAQAELRYRATSDALCSAQAYLVDYRSCIGSVRDVAPYIPSSEGRGVFVCASGGNGSGKLSIVDTDGRVSGRRIWETSVDKEAIIMWKIRVPCAKMAASPIGDSEGENKTLSVELKDMYLLASTDPRTGIGKTLLYSLQVPGGAAHRGEGDQAVIEPVDVLLGQHSSDEQNEREVSRSEAKLSGGLARMDVDSCTISGGSLLSHLLWVQVTPGDVCVMSTVRSTTEEEDNCVVNFDLTDGSAPVERTLSNQAADDTADNMENGSLHQQIDGGGTGEIFLSAVQAAVKEHYVVVVLDNGTARIWTVRSIWTCDKQDASWETGCRVVREHDVVTRYRKQCARDLDPHLDSNGGVESEEVMTTPRIAVSDVLEEIPSGAVPSCLVRDIRSVSLYLPCTYDDSCFSLDSALVLPVVFCCVVSLTCDCVNIVSLSSFQLVFVIPNLSSVPPVLFPQPPEPHKHRCWRCGTTTTPAAKESEKPSPLFPQTSLTDISREYHSTLPPTASPRAQSTAASDPAKQVAQVLCVHLVQLPDTHSTGPVLVAMVDGRPILIYKGFCGHHGHSECVTESLDYLTCRFSLVPHCHTAIIPKMPSEDGVKCASLEYVGGACVREFDKLSGIGGVWIFPPLRVSETAAPGEYVDGPSGLWLLSHRNELFIHTVEHSRTWCLESIRTSEHINGYLSLCSVGALDLSTLEPAECYHSVASTLLDHCPLPHPTVFSSLPFQTIPIPASPARLATVPIPYSWKGYPPGTLLAMACYVMVPEGPELFECLKDHTKEQLLQISADSSHECANPADGTGGESAAVASSENNPSEAYARLQGNLTICGGLEALSPLRKQPLECDAAFDSPTAMQQRVRCGKEPQDHDVGYEIMAKRFYVVLYHSSHLFNPIGIYHLNALEEVLTLSFSQVNDSYYVLIGTATNLGELSECYGRLCVLSVDTPAKSPPSSSSRSRAVPAVWRETQELHEWSANMANGPVFAVNQLTCSTPPAPLSIPQKHFVAHSMGQKLFAHDFDANGKFVGGAFYDCGGCITCSAMVKRYIVLGDAHKGIHLLTWHYDSRSNSRGLQRVARSPPQHAMTVIACGPIVLGHTLGLLCSDPEGNVFVFCYNSKPEASLNITKHNDVLYTAGGLNAHVRITKMVRALLCRKEATERFLSTPEGSASERRKERLFSLLEGTKSGGGNLTSQDDLHQASLSGVLAVSNEGALLLFEPVEAEAFHIMSDTNKTLSFLPHPMMIRTGLTDLLTAPVTNLHRINTGPNLMNITDIKRKIPFLSDTVLECFMEELPSHGNINTS